MDHEVLTRLVLLDLQARARSILALLPAVVITALVFGASLRTLGPAPVLVITMAMVTWGHGLRGAHDDEKAQTWPFLRVLPLNPPLLVTARFLSTAVALLAYTAFAVATCALTSAYVVGAGVGWRESLLGGLSGLAVGLALSSIFHAVYFRAGYRAANSTTSYVMLLFVLPLLSATLFQGGAGSFSPLANLGGWINAWTGTHPGTTAAVTTLGATAMVIAGWAFSVAALSRREFR